MKKFLKLSLLLPVLVISACGGNKSAPVNNMSSQFKLEPFFDVNNPSTLDLTTLDKSIPSVMNLNSIMPSPKNQGNRGTCSFFTTISMVEAAIKKTTKRDVNLSEEYLNYVVKTQGYFARSEGSYEYANLYYTQKAGSGFLYESDWPYQPSWFLLKKECKSFMSNDKNAPAICFSHNAPPEETLKRIIPAKDFKGIHIIPDNTNEIIETLAKYKLPIAIGVAVNFDGWPDNGKTSFTEAMRQDCIDKKVECGQHGILLTGYDLEKKVFYFRNSWGKKWGDNGDGTIPFEVVDKHVERDLYLIDLENKIQLPEELNKDGYKLKRFSIQSKLNADNSITISNSASVYNSGLYAVSVSSILSKINTENFHSPTDSNVTNISLTDEEAKSVGYYRHRETIVTMANLNLKTVEWNDNSDYDLTIPSNFISQPTVQAINQSKNENLILATEIYIFSDEGPKTLKKYFHPIQFSSKPVK